MKVEKVIGYTVQVTSTGEQYTVTGNVNVEGMSLTNITAAMVKKTDTQEELADFSWYGTLNINFRTEMSDTDTCNLIKAVKDYISSAKSSAESGEFGNPANAETETSETV